MKLAIQPAIAPTDTASRGTSTTAATSSRPRKTRWISLRGWLLWKTRVKLESSAA